MKAAELLAAIEAARRASSSACDAAGLDAALAGLDAALAAPWRPLHPHSVAENFEVIVVALAVAMAFRCYFLQPFRDRDTVLFAGFHAPGEETLRRWAELVKPYVSAVSIRGNE